MPNKEITAIINEYNDVNGIVYLITQSLILYYHVNGFNSENFKDDYLNYLRRIFSDRRFHFLNTEKLLSCKDQIFSTVTERVRDDLLEKLEPEELYQSCQWQPEALEAVLTELFDNR